ncbi:hypothetical protein GIB67_016504 [Kingdonia uniflora]|uniref:BHLH domain-containing protein n=1 Tax=Kingdonia uniflora TaxID=39325 RepID=A0A7J7M834_9MAGN|nr:hypothetical protein GIB67_016504 [Kingdonia uniflora]
MALEAVVFPQEMLHYSFKDLLWSYDYYGLEDEQQHKDEGFVGLNGNNNTYLWENNSSSTTLLVQEHGKDISQEPNSPNFTGGDELLLPSTTITTSLSSGGRSRKRRRSTRTCKNKEEVENQRMTHITVERNRRKQMNEYLAVLRSLMPSSYVQRGDQASIIGGAINFVKELEQLIQSLEAQKRTENQSDPNSYSRPFADFFTFPQYSSSLTSNDLIAENQSAIADIEVTMVDSHANLKVLSKKRPKQLLKMVAGFQSLRFAVLHLNLTTTVDEMVLYSFSLKLEEDCKLTTVDEIATAVYQMMGRIQEEDAR